MLDCSRAWEDDSFCELELTAAIEFVSELSVDLAAVFNVALESVSAFAVAIADILIKMKGEKGNKSAACSWVMASQTWEMKAIIGAMPEAAQIWNRQKS